MLHHADPLYNMVLQVTIEGGLCRTTFGIALESVVKRCDSLRTTFTESDGAPCRRILDTVHPVLEYLDFSDKPAAEEQAQSWCQSRAARQFKLSQRLFDCALLRVAADRHIWFISNHHLIADATSMANIVREVGLAYTRRLNNPLNNQLPDPSLPQYADFLRHQHEAKKTPQFHQAAKYWLEKTQTLVSSPPPAIEFYGSQPKSVSTASNRFKRQLSGEQNTKIRALALNPEIRALTPDMTVHNIFVAALAALLHRLTGRGDLVIGTPAANRPTKSLKETIGLLVELYPLQLQIDENENFVSLLKKAREQNNGLLMNAQSGASQPEALRSFNVVLNYISAKINLPGFKTASQWLHPKTGDSNHHLRLEVHDFDSTGEPELLFDLNQDVFDKEASQWLMDHFFRVLDTLIDDPQCRISQIELVEQSEAISPKDITPESARGNTTIVSIFRECVEHYPDRTALATDDYHLTYRALDELATTLASKLITDHQVARGDIIGIACNRDAETIIGILATLIAGGAYLPIDPAYPDQRISLILEDAQPKLLLAPDSGQSRLANFGVPLESVNISELQTSSAPVEVGLSIEPADLAYLLYTSGTTGTPNGVLVEHRNVVSLTAGLHQCVYPGTAEALNIALVAPFAFDASVQQIFSALLGGHCLHIVPESTRLDGTRLRAFYAERAIDLSDGTPAHLGLISDTGSPMNLQLPRRFVLGGDRMNRAQILAFYQAVHPQKPQIINIYGVAECSVDTTFYLITPDSIEALSELIPIGKPLPESQVTIVSEAGKQQPTGVAGQILIAGAGVSRGYLNRPELTKSKFVPHPLHPNRRAYLTGDQGRIDSDGNLHFLGRRDGQIKSRGIRIETGEIEHHLLSFQVRANSAINIETNLDRPSAQAQRCRTCLLTTAHPEVSLNQDDICNVCEEWSDYAQASQTYFQSIKEFQHLRAVAAKGRESAEYDCMLLYSGGKDSSYVLHRLVELGLKVLAFTFDNGFISNAAFENIRRQTATLQVDSIVERASAMDEIFVESLLADATVCSGCFRALTAISTRLAHEKNINMVVTGLSRGQIFDTKLAGLYKQGIVEVAQVEQNLQLFRKVFHANEDRTAQLLSVDLKTVDIDQIHFVDFFRYDNIGVSGVRDYLRARDDYWSQPQDTGFCSSNCVMNDVGICVHSSQKGFHNYEAPLSWDIRLGVSHRDEVIGEVTSPINLKSSTKILQRIGFFSKKIQRVRVLGSEAGDATDHLTAYFQATQTIAPEDLRTYLAQRLPNYLVPSRFVQVAQMPYTAHGKTDDRVLRHYDQNTEQTGNYQGPTNAIEEQLVEIWAQVLGLETVGVNDNFFDLGGDSIAAIRIVGRANTIGLSLEAPQLLEKQTISKLATTGITRLPASQAAVSGPVPMTPVLRWFLSKTEATTAKTFSQVVSVRLQGLLDAQALTEALRVVIGHHDVLRLAFTHGARGWQVSNRADLGHYPTVETVQSIKPNEGQRKQVITAMAERFDLAQAQLIQATLLTDADSCELIIVANHLVVDAVSWSILLEDLESAYRQIVADQSPTLPNKTHSFQAWAHALTTYATTATFNQEKRYWRARETLAGVIDPIPKNPDIPNTEEHSTTRITSLDKRATASLLSVATQSKRPIQELLLAALGLAIAKGTTAKGLAQPCVRIDVEGHGRESFQTAPDISRTVGWFTSLYPVSLSVSGIDFSSQAEYPDLQTLDAITDQIQAVPGNGFTFGLLQYLAPRATLTAPADSPVLFNYLGLVDSVRPKTDSRWRLHDLALYRSPGMLRRHSLEVAASLGDGALSIEWAFPAGAQQLAAIEALEADFLAVLRAIMALLADPTRQRSAAEFPQAKLNSKSLNKLAAALGKADARATDRGTN